jgi:branched-subunit amino acid transport protein
MVGAEVLVIDVLALVLLGLASWLLRIGLLVLVPASRLPAAVRGALVHVAPAVLAPLLALDLLQALRATPGTAGAAATAVAALAIAAVAWRTRNVALTAGVALASVVLLDVVV